MEGWVCAKCGRSYSPSTQECKACNGAAIGPVRSPGVLVAGRALKFPYGGGAYEPAYDWPERYGKQIVYTGGNGS